MAHPTQQAPPAPAPALARAVDLSTKQLVVPPPDDPGTVYRVMDHADELQIADDIAGRAVDAWAYQFEIGGKLVQGLSWKGVTEAVVQMSRKGLGRLTIDKSVPPVFSEIVEDGEPTWECMAYAIDLESDSGRWGMATTKMNMRLRSGQTKPDNMAKRKTMSKAQRNALLALIPTEFQVTVLTAAIESGKMQQLQTPRQTARVEAGQRHQAVINGTGADAPRRGAVATSKQQGLINVRFREHGIEDDRVQRAIIGWATDGATTFLDRLPKADVDTVLEAIADRDGTLDVITTKAEDGDDRAKWIVEHLLEPYNASLKAGA